MNKMSLAALTHELRTQIADRNRKVLSRTVFGGHEKTLRQTLIVMAEGGQLAEHESPGDSTVHVLSGHVNLYTDTESWQGRTGDLLIIPDARHGVDAVTDCSFLLTVAKA